MSDSIALMERDEERTVERCRTFLAHATSQIVPTHAGRSMLKVPADGFIAEFPDARAGAALRLRAPCRPRALQYPARRGATRHARRHPRRGSHRRGVQRARRRRQPRRRPCRARESGRNHRLDAGARPAHQRGRCVGRGSGRAAAAQPQPRGARFPRLAAGADARLDAQRGGAGARPAVDRGDPVPAALGRPALRVDRRRPGRRHHRRAVAHGGLLRRLAPVHDGVPPCAGRRAAHRRDARRAVRALGQRADRVSTRAARGRACRRARRPHRLEPALPGRRGRRVRHAGRAGAQGGAEPGAVRALRSSSSARASRISISSTPMR